MMDSNDYTSDFMRILFGDFSILIYVEIILRVLVIMVHTILMIRWIGKRAVGGLGSADILLIVAFGSAVGDAMLYPSIPLSIPIFVITLIAAFQRAYVSIGIRYSSVRKITHPTVLKLVENGRLLTENFAMDEIDENEVLMLLRQSGIRYLSQVEHSYYEQSGKLSVYKSENPILENSILPEHIDNLNFKKRP